MVTIFVAVFGSLSSLMVTFKMVQLWYVDSKKFFGFALAVFVVVVVRVVLKKSEEKEGWVGEKGFCTSTARARKEDPVKEDILLVC